MAHKYAIALAEVSLSDLEKFDVVTVPRSGMTTLVIKWSDPIEDKTGQTEPVPTHWANGWIVEDSDWNDEHTAIIMNAVAEYNAKHVDNQIPSDYPIIWE
jgi:hypothetical protein